MKRVQRGSTERLYFEFRDADDALTDPVSPTVTIEDSTETALIDSDNVTLSGVTLTKESLGVYYWVFKPKLTQALGIVYCWPKGTINGVIQEQDVPIEVEIVAKEAIPDQNLLVSVFAVKELLKIENAEQDALIHNLIKRVSASVEQFCNRQFKARRYTEYHDGDGSTGLIVIKNPPILTLNSLYDDPDRLFPANTAFISADFVFYATAGLVQLVYSSNSTLLPTDKPTFSKGFKNVKIVYTGGYSAVPNDVELGTAIWVTHLYRKVDEKTWAKDSRQRGDHSEQFQQQDKITQTGIRRMVGMPNETRELLEPYRLENL